MRVKVKKNTTGVCALTGIEGKFAKCHILPRALTKPEINGGKFLQIETKRKFLTRNDSWYDRSLVIEEGERILRDLDTIGIEFLRERNLVWSAIKPIGHVKLEQGIPTGNSEGVLNVTVSNPVQLRKFWLSLLWRSAASRIADMDKVTLPDGDLEKIRGEICGEINSDPFFYPVSLFHLCTTGMRHNVSPYFRYFDKPSPFNCYARIQMDGIVALFWPYAKSEDISFLERNAFVGNSKNLSIVSRPYENSWSNHNIDLIIEEFADSQ